MIHPRRVALLAATLLTATSMLSAANAVTSNYGLLTTIAIPATAANNQGGAFTSFDIGFVDAVTGYYYIADRSNASVDIINGATNKVVGQAVGFAGQKATTSVSGPDGVVVVNNSSGVTLYAGDGGSLLRAFNVANPAAPVALGVVSTGGGAFRVDEMAYSPATNQIFAANNANTPAYASLITATASPSVTRTNITVPNQVASGGLEQSVWNPATGTFFVSVPTFNGTDAGGVQEYDSAGNPLRTYNFTAMGLTTGCSPAGLALGASGNLVVGCGTAGTQTIVLNPAGTGTVRSVSGVSGSDELWYDPASGNYFLTGSNAAGDRVIDILSDSTFTITQSINLTSYGAGKVNAHSVAVDPLNGEIFVPLEGTVGTLADTLCPTGCVAVFSTLVPEPTTRSLLLTALAGVLGMAGWTRFRQGGKFGSLPLR